MRLEVRVAEISAAPFEQVTRDGKKRFARAAYDLLESGRTQLAARRYVEAFTVLSVARRSLYDAMKPEQRWYLNGPFQIVSNRALAAERLGYWSPCRHDTRMTMFMQNDHVRSYERLPRTADAFGARGLTEELAVVVKQLKTDPPRIQGEWRRMVQKGVAWMSIRGIMAAIADELDDKLMGELIQIGIEDMYTSVNLPADIIGPLSCLNEARME
jgi:hypothetical protein